MKKKSIRQSKNLIISLFAAFLCLAAGTVRAQAGRVTIDMQQVKMTQIMDEIEKQTKFLFIYDKNISVDRTASVAGARTAGCRGSRANARRHRSDV